VSLVLALFVGAAAGPARSFGEIPFKAERLSDRVLFIRSGESSVMSNVTAIAAADGLVIIDSHYKPRAGEKIRGLVEREFGRSDFAYLIYSHAGVDHMGGTPAFPKTVIVGHDSAVSTIDGLHKTLDDIDIREGMAPRLDLIKKRMEAGAADPREEARLRDARIYWGELTDLLAGGFRYSLPGVTFSDRMTLYMGDLRLELRYVTPGYSRSDILIHVPEEKLLVTGDIFLEHRVPLLNEKTDIARWEAVFRPFIDGEVEIRHITSCHGERLTLDDIRTQLDYLTDLWAAVAAARREGLTLEQAQKRLNLKDRYPHLSHLITRWASTPFDLHERNIEQAWKGSAAIFFPR